MEPLSLYELNSMVRGVVEDAMGEEYWVLGELSEGGARYGGHFYGELIQKDEKGMSIIAKARVTCWQNVYRKLSLYFERETGETLRAGIKVLLLVQVSFHEQYGYSLNIVDIDPSYTLGDMAQKRKEILRQLEEDGILHDNQTLKLPTLAKRVAVVSSASAAGFGDFCNQLEHNEYGFSFGIKLFPAVMQGSRVEESVIEALDSIIQEEEKWDVVAIIRGGGATSDLSDFDSYPLAAYIAQFPLPVITGIGHERDETVLDYVAHTRQKTPTAVAAFLIDHMCEAASHLEELRQTILQLATQRLECEKQRLNRNMVVIPLVFGKVRQREDNALENMRQRIVNAWKRQQEREHHKVELLQVRLDALDPNLLLKRGYSITMVGDKIVRSADELSPGDVLTTRLERGEILSTVICKNK